MTEAGAEVAFDLELDHGRCVGVRIPADDAPLVDEERAHASRLGPVRRRTWIAGRVALRAALARTGVEAGPILPDDRGAPRLPRGIAGSVSHKEGWAVALVSREDHARIGVDVEEDRARGRDVSSRVCTDEELVEIAGLDPDARGREVILRFSAKEAIYKALDPFVRRYVGFHEVSVTPRPDGTAVVRETLSSGEGRFVIEVCWRRVEGLVLTTARVVPAPPYHR